MKDELDRKIMKEFVGLRVKKYSYLTGDNEESKKAEGTKNVQQNENLNFKITKLFRSNSACKYNKLSRKKCNKYLEYHKYCIINNRLMIKSQQR